MPSAENIQQKNHFSQDRLAALIPYYLNCVKKKILFISLLGGSTNSISITTSLSRDKMVNCHLKDKKGRLLQI